MGKGFMILPREIRRWSWYRNSKMVHMLVHLMLEAQYQDSSYMGIEIKRGQLVTGRKQLAVETGMSEREVRTCLERLQNDQQISIKTTNRFSIITVCNYDSWQCVIKTDDQQTTSRAPTNDQPNDHIQIINKDKEDNNKEKDSKESKKKKEELDFSIVAPEYLEIVQTWLQYKKEKNQSFKPTGFKTMYNKLIKLSGNNPETAKKIVEQSMSNNWAGLFELKDEPQGMQIGVISRDKGGSKFDNMKLW